MLTTAYPIPFSFEERVKMGAKPSTVFMVRTSIPMFKGEVIDMLQEAWTVWHQDEPDYEDIKVTVFAQKVKA